MLRSVSGVALMCKNGQEVGSERRGCCTYVVVGSV